MHLKQQRKIIFAITIFYTLLILYFLFFAFGRVGKVDQITEYTFIFLPDSFFRLPGLSDLLHPTLMDFVDFANIAAFIPFGILIPLLYRTNFVRFMTLFILSILVLETIQALTFLGSFDINDVIQNSLGAAVGFGAYKLGFRTKNNWRNTATMGISSVVLMLGVWGVFGMLDQVFTKELGPFVAINELKDSTGNPLTGTKRSSLKMGGQDVEPKYNVYSIEGKKKETYTYTLGNKEELYFSLNYGIPDQKDFQGSIKLTVDGHEFLSASAEDQRHEPDMTEIFLPQANELTITIEGNETLWDVGFREMIYFWN
ncbi:Glycopeptide antibiotics resistance protein [Paenibacillus algorifonticola]|uniref:Glycopeptide antibiotics resistance protein n=1 Tax=Paenibacillus algorifonticola TaxID=684063 RepID=A0A1I2G0W5_9BACL|nr:VanZ family protein [Paenibacillus algorifonticola]SFF10769.1 Glycopeptide antibiotics resistance protein [Paenibacillus algorifonticola]